MSKSYYVSLIMLVLLCTTVELVEVLAAGVADRAQRLRKVNTHDFRMCLLKRNAEEILRFLHGQMRLSPVVF